MRFQKVRNELMREDDRAVLAVDPINIVSVIQVLKLRVANVQVLLAICQ